MGFLWSLLINVFLPQMSPAWGPPSNLSPEKVTTPAPELITSRTTGSKGRENLPKSNNAPLPRSTIRGIRLFFDTVASSATDTSLVNPSTR